MFVSREAAEVLRASMEQRHYTLREFARLTNNTTGAIQRLRQGNTEARTCNFEAIFNLLPEFKDFLVKQEQARVSELRRLRNPTPTGDHHRMADNKLAFIANGAEQVAIHQQVIEKPNELPSIGKTSSTNMCPVIDSWTVQYGSDNENFFVSPRKGLEYTAIPFGYYGNTVRDGLFAVQLTNDENAPTVPAGTVVYAQWLLPPMGGKAHLLFHKNTLFIGRLKERVDLNAYVFTLLDGTPVTLGHEAFRGRIVGWFTPA